jgi:hypothetical protein
MHIVGGDIGVSSAQATMELLGQKEQELGAGSGIAIVVSRNARSYQNTIYNEGQIWRALTRIPLHLPWAIAAEVRDSYENWDQLVIGQIVSAGMSKIAGEVPMIGQILQLAQRLKQVAWVAETLSVAAYGNPDEIDLSAQMFARAIASWLVGQVIDKAVSMVKGGVQGAIAKLRKRAGGGQMKTQSKKPPTDTPPTEKAPPPGHATVDQAPPIATVAPPATQQRALPAASPPEPKSRRQLIRDEYDRYSSGGGEKSMQQWWDDLPEDQRQAFARTRQPAPTPHDPIPLPPAPPWVDGRLAPAGIKTPTRYRWQNPRNRFGNFIEANLFDGVLSVTVKAHAEDAIRRGGQKMLDDVFSYFGDKNIRAFAGKWVQDSTFRDNYDRFQRNLRAGMSHETAAWNTWTGEQMKRRGFTKVEVTVGYTGGRDSVGSPVVYTRFTR